MSKFQKVRQVTLQVLKLEKGQPRYVYLLAPMHTGKQLEKDKDAATLCHAVDMETGEEGVIICPAIMSKELNESYPGDSYVGKGFEIVVTRVPEKRYNLVTISEVAVPDDFTPPTVVRAETAAPAAQHKVKR